MDHRLKTQSDKKSDLNFILTRLQYPNKTKNNIYFCLSKMITLIVFDLVLVHI